MEPDIPNLIIARREAIAVLRLNRPKKRNAIDDSLVLALGRFFESPPDGVRAVVLTGAGAHF